MRGSVGALVVLLSACGGMMGSLTPVPPVHRLPPDVAGAVVLVAEDPVIETKDPNHVVRANEQGVPQAYRAAMETALALAGFRVTKKPDERHDLVAKLAIAVTDEDDEHVRQVYRCGLRAAGGAEVAQIDWMWPRGIYVGQFEVLDYASHNLATEVVLSRPVLAFLRARTAPP